MLKIFPAQANLPQVNKYEYIYICIYMKRIPPNYRKINESKTATYIRTQYINAREIFCNRNTKPINLPIST
jgi:hypothetical protein